MPEMKKHVGQLNNTGRRVIVAFMQLPNDPDHALVIDSDALPDRFHDAVMKVLESLEGQSERDFANILSRRPMPDTGYDMLTTLHQAGYLVRVPVQNVTMLPLPNYPTPLIKIIELMGGQAPAVQQAPVAPTANEDRFNQHAVNVQVDKNEEMIGTARNLLALAQDMENDAYRKREEAYRLCPSLRPQAAPVAQAPVAPMVTSATAPSAAEVLGALKASNAKRGPGRPPKVAAQ